MIAATKRGQARLAEIQTKLAASASTNALAPFVSARNAQEAWDRLDRECRRAVIGAMVTVVLHPTGRSARLFDPATVEIRWHEAAA
jgi:site-specific DNA recombinase